MTSRERSAARPLTADDVVGAAGRIVDDEGIEALTMRRLSDELGVAVTSIYWHVGNRQDLIEALVARFLADMGTLRADGDTPGERITGLARSLRAKLLERPNLVALAHQRAETPLVFQPVRSAVARELSLLGYRGEAAALPLRALEAHVVASVLLERVLERYPASPGTEAPVPSGDVDDEVLAAALRRPADPLELFEFGLQAILVALPRAVT